jgi:hypothetical protein
LATSIVAIACGLQHLGSVAVLVTGLNSMIFVLLSVFTLARLVLFRREMHDDLINARAPGFLTIPAGSALLGCQLVLIEGWNNAAFMGGKYRLLGAADICNFCDVHRKRTKTRP